MISLLAETSGVNLADQGPYRGTHPGSSNFDSYFILFVALGRYMHEVVSRAEFTRTVVEKKHFNCLKLSIKNHATFFLVYSVAASHVWSMGRAERLGETNFAVCVCV